MIFFSKSKKIYRQLSDKFYGIYYKKILINYKNSFQKNEIFIQMANYRSSSNFRKNSQDFMEEETDFISKSKENTEQMYENESSSDDSRDYSENLDSKRAFQQNQTHVDMKYISKTLTKYVRFSNFKLKLSHFRLD